MAESTLNLPLNELRAAVGDFLGYGRGSVVYSETTWTTLQSTDIDDVIKSGLRNVYDPPVLPGERVAHNWSFLRPYANLTLDTADRATTLPDGFGGLEGPVFCTTDSAAKYWPIKVVTPEIIEAKAAAQPDQTGPPVWCAERVGSTTSSTASTRSELIVWPTPDQAYVVRISYYYHPDFLTTNNPYPPGGAAHAEMFKAACIAAAELFRDDERGVRYAYFLDRLRASVHADRRRKGQHLGYNGDGSDCPVDPHIGRQWGRFYNTGNPITVNGSVPT